MTIIYPLIILIFIILSITILIILLSRTRQPNTDNGLFHSEYLANKRALIIVPHQDDELLVAGDWLLTLKQAGSEVFVCYTTNGDYTGNGNVRLQEAINCLSKVGIDKSHIYFMGYGDQLQKDSKHLYNQTDFDLNLISKSGLNCTYGLKNHPDIRTEISGKPSLYTRDNFKIDLKDIILLVNPNLILCVDYDPHADHRAASLIFDEVIREIKMTYNGFSPRIFKTFAYFSEFWANDDFYHPNILSTVPNFRNFVPPYPWSSRVRFPVSTEMLSYTKRSSLMYALLKTHRSQPALKKLGRIVNGDKVFWERDIDNLLFNASSYSSSGNCQFLNDNKLFDSENILDPHSSLNFNNWMPENNDNEKYVIFKFDQPQVIDKIVVYQSPSKNTPAWSGTLELSNGMKIPIQSEKNDLYHTDICFKSQSDISWLKIMLDSFDNYFEGFSEIGAYHTKFNDITKFIKLTDQADNFIYTYYSTPNKDIILRLYSDNEKLLDLSCFEYSVNGTFIDPEFSNDGQIIISNLKTGSYDLKIRSSENDRIFDEVKIIVGKFPKYLKLLVEFEKIVDRSNRVLELIFSKVKKFDQ